MGFGAEHACSSCCSVFGVLLLFFSEKVQVTPFEIQMFASCAS